MNAAPPPVLTPGQVLHVLAAHRWRWLLPAAVIAGVVGVYALFAPPTWEVSQALLLRNEAAGNPQAPGKFSQTDEMKTVQETILELARSRGVLEAALGEVGPPARRPAAQCPLWPGPEDVAALRDSVRLVPPKGAEFGKTEVFYLNVRDADRDRATALVQAICTQLEARFQDVRDARARSMIDELSKTVRLAGADLAESTARLTETEKLAGGDLAELRILLDANSGESVLRRTMTEVENELRQAQAARQAGAELLDLLRSAQQDPGALVATPSRLLESQPSLRRLKEGLIDAQLQTAQLRGRMSDQHPLVVSAQKAEEEVAGHLHDELALAVRGVEADLRLADSRIAMLGRRLAELEERFSRLAAVRASYANQVAENRNRMELLQRAEKDLAEARAAQAGAKATSLIARIDAPDAGTRPVGPGRMMVVLAGIAGGLLAGLGVVALTVGPLGPDRRDGQPSAATLAAACSGRNGKGTNGRHSAAEGSSLKDALKKLANGRMLP